MNSPKIQDDDKINNFSKWMEKIEIQELKEITRSNSKNKEEEETIKEI